ncbi:MAG: LicD family protein [Paludibacteraceae bacterium]|nr:LicD family protein [Paludibacteraceae bacterium]
MRGVLVKITKRLGLYQKFVQLDTYLREKKIQKAFKKYGLETLIQADRAFRSFNADMFLVFGTLLGAYRDNGFIAHDFDLDVGLLASQRPDDIAERMEKFGFRRVRQFYVKESGRVTEEQFEYKGVQIDVFYYFDMNPDKVYCYVARRHETKDWREANKTDGFPSVLFPCDKCEMEEVDFLGSKIKVPALRKSWLSDIYGEDFMTPIKNWTAGTRKTAVLKHTERLYRKQW